MKTLQKRAQVLYRFRCERCRSLFEMTEEEKTENDWKFTNYHYSYKEGKYICGPVNRDKKKISSNPLDYFECPVCKCVRHVQRGDMHKYSVMDDGTEIKEY
jgi:hypothetical protein